MGYGDAARDKAQAKVSELEAQVAALKSELSKANTELQGAQAVDDVVDKVTGPDVVRDATAPVRDKTNSLVSTAQAKVDKIQSDLTTTEAKLSTYQKAQGAIDAITDPE